MPSNQLRALLWGLSVCVPLACLPACGRNEPYDPSPAETLAERRETVVEAIRPLLDPETGWPSVEDCDGLLWASLLAAAGLPVRLEVAEYAPGEMHRRPKPCVPGDSKSEISNDMLVGYAWALHARRDLAGAKRLRQYAEDHGWVMGEGAIERTLARPNLRALIGRLAGMGGGPAVYLPVQEDYERHLQALGILLFGELDGHITDQMLDRLREIGVVEPENALFAAALDRYQGTATAPALLLESDYVPSYVRGLGPLRDVAWLFTAMLILGPYGA